MLYLTKHREPLLVLSSLLSTAPAVGRNKSGAQNTPDTKMEKNSFSFPLFLGEKGEKMMKKTAIMRELTFFRMHGGLSKEVNDGIL